MRDEYIPSAIEVSFDNEGTSYSSDNVQDALNENLDIIRSLIGDYIYNDEHFIPRNLSFNVAKNLTFCIIKNAKIFNFYDNLLVRQNDKLEIGNLTEVRIRHEFR